MWCVRVPVLPVRSASRAAAIGRQRGNADDVALGPGWLMALEHDLATADDRTVGVQARIRVPVGPGPLDDRDRQTRQLETGRWITADMAYRRRALAETGGFDESFRRAYREDSDLGLRAGELGELMRGERLTEHPVRTESWAAAIGRQRGNADDVAMRRLHGRAWRAASSSPRGRLHRHLALMGALASTSLLWRRHRGAAAVTAAVVAGGYGELLADRASGVDRTPSDLLGVAASTLAIPPAAVAWWLWGLATRRPRRPRPPAAVLFDRDGTLIEDVPYNGDDRLVAPFAGVGNALARLRSTGVAVALVTNQSAVGHGWIGATEVEACHERLQQLVGPFDAIAWCPHTPSDDCDCRKPRRGLLTDVIDRLGVDPAECVVIGDTAGDLGAAAAVGARAILVPNAETAPHEVATAPNVAPNVAEAVAMALTGAT
jgi:histidinol-phosphate phosphatase family protein